MGQFEISLLVESHFVDLGAYGGPQQHSYVIRLVGTLVFADNSTNLIDYARRRLLYRYIQTYKMCYLSHLFLDAQGQDDPDHIIIYEWTAI